MKNQMNGHVIGIPVTSVTYAAEELQTPCSIPEPVSPFLHPSSYGSSNSKQKKRESVIHWMSKITKQADGYVQGIRDHVSLGPKITETVKGKLSLSARIIQAGGVKRVFRQLFSTKKGEKLLNAFQCHLSTTSGPIAGLLFISTDKIAFHSDRPIALTSPKGELARVPYKILIPLRMVKSTISSENENKPNQKYIQIATVDDFEFWFMGFVSYQKSFGYLRKAISGSQ